MVAKRNESETGAADESKQDVIAIWILRIECPEKHHYWNGMWYPEAFHFVVERPRSPMATRGALPAQERSETSTERDVGSHSVDRIVGLFF
jgi:hypothetical protein